MSLGLLLIGLRLDRCWVKVLLTHHPKLPYPTLDRRLYTLVSDKRLIPRSLLYLPLTSLFHPILSFPENLSKFLSPPKRLIEMYAESWTSGTQIRNLTALKEHVENGEPLKLLNRMGEYLEKNAKERKEEIEKLKVKREAEKRLREQEQERLKQQAAEVIQDRATGQREMVVDVVVDRDGSKRLVQRPYQMEELKKQDEQLKKMSDRFKKDENEVD